MHLSGEKDIFDFLDTTMQASEPMRTQLAERFAIDACYYEAIQWINRTLGFQTQRPVNQRLTTDYHPDSRKLRAIDNDVTRLTQKAAASTFPDQVYMDVHPSERDANPDAALRASVHESFINALIDDSGFIVAARRANEVRSIVGVDGIVLGLDAGQDGTYLCMDRFDATCLVLDPYCQKRHLHHHPHVTFHDIWTLDRIKAAFGVDLDPNECQTVEAMDPQKIELAQLSQNKMFSRYVRFSKAKAARVYQGHVREGRRFGQWFVAIETAGKKRKLIVDGETPFGGVGMPFALLHGYFRSDTMWSWGEPAQLKDDQDQKNLIKTLDNRILQQYAHHRPVIDRRWFGTQSGNDDDIIRQLSNRVGQPIIGGAGDRTRNVMPPTTLPAPPPPSFIMDYLDRHTDSMVAKTHKAPGNFGLAKTHVPDSTNQRVLDDADQVATVRIKSDVEAYEYLIGVLHATGVKLIQGNNPATAALVRREGFEPQDIAILHESDPAHPDVLMSVREATVRHRSHTMRKAELDQAATLGLIDAPTYRLIMAETLEVPVDEADRQMVDQARKAASEILRGKEWVPTALGPWNDIFIRTFVRSQFTPIAKADPEVAARLVRAIQSQMMRAYEEKILADPSLAAQATAPPAGGAGAEAEADPNQAVSVADVLDGLSRGGSGADASVPASAA